MEETPETQSAPSSVRWQRNGFRLNQFTVLPDQRAIRTPEGQSIGMEDRVMSVLLELARRPGEVISHEEFMDSVWGDTVVEPSVLSRAIALLRSALGDNARDPQFIKTYHRRGYQLIAEVTPLEAETPPSVRSRAVLALSMVGVVLVLAGLFGWQTLSSSPKVAVIPFTAPDDPRLPAGGEGLADYLIGALTASADLSVVARRDSFAVRGATMDVESIGDTLEADYLVGGELSLSGDDRIRLILSLTDTEQQADLWSGQMSAAVGDLASLHGEALTALSAALVEELQIAPLAPAAPTFGINAEAYRKYLEAVHQWNLRGAPRINRAIDLLDQAIELEPEFAEAQLALARSLAIKPFYTDVPLAEYFARARTALARVPGPDRGFDAEVSALKGFMFMEEHRWTESEQHLQQALKQDPDNALAHYWYSYLLSIFGDYQQALVEMQRAAALDPWSAVVNDRLALAYLWVGDLAGATRQYQIATDLGYLESNQVSPAVLYAVRRQDWEAIRTLLLRLGNDPGWVEAFVTGLADPALRPASAGIIDQAMAEGQIDRRFWFGIWVLLKDSDRAFRDFNAQPKSQDIELLWARDSAFLRQDPRFEDLVHSVGLADRARATFPD